MEQTLLELPTDLTISHVQTFKQDALNFISDVQHVIISDRSLDKIDTLGVQLLLALIDLILSEKKQLTWQADSELLKETVRQLGLADSDFKHYLFEH